MTSTGDEGGGRPLDPDFAGLFRAEDTLAPAPGLVPATVSPFAVPPPAADPAASDSASPEPPAARPPVDTGRLFRSQGVAGHSDTVLAVATEHSGRLRTLEREAEPPVPAAPAAPVEVPPNGAMSAEVAPTELADAGAVIVSSHDEEARSSRGARLGGRSISGGAVYLIVIGVTVLVGFANALLSGGDIGWPTGIALLVSTVYTALTVRRADDSVAIITPPIAFLVAALTAGQVWLGAAEGSLINRAAVLFFTLADNWAWIIGSTGVALVIVLVRRRRS